MCIDKKLSIILNFMEDFKMTVFNTKGVFSGSIEIELDGDIVK